MPVIPPSSTLPLHKPSLLTSTRLFLRTHTVCIGVSPVHAPLQKYCVRVAAVVNVVTRAEVPSVTIAVSVVKKMLICVLVDCWSVDDGGGGRNDGVGGHKQPAGPAQL